MLRGPGIGAPAESALVPSAGGGGGSGAVTCGARWNAGATVGGVFCTRPGGGVAPGAAGTAPGAAGAAAPGAGVGAPGSGPPRGGGAVGVVVRGAAPARGVRGVAGRRRRGARGPGARLVACARWH